MSKEEKKNVIISICLCLAAVLIFWLWGKHGGSLMAPAAASPDGIAPLTATAAPDPTYTTYNIPPYNPGTTQILGPQGLGPLSSGNSCCDDCGENGIAMTAAQYQALSGA